MKAITADTVRKMAELSRLALDEAETTQFARELSAIIEYASNLPELPQDAMDEGSLRVESDEVVADEGGKDLLRNAVAREKGFVKVPAILDRPL